ncbi:carbohydrate-binding protein [Methylococcaceae bacterium CS1]|nr:discoidin domain-containing protein [Methyloprofundus sp.]TXK99241.1 carbohydrate-binding protein [Methylococcaceae bacterium CS4]TXL00165.1 carbohydrate-binding protein [Methylococcaceae bacterium CS5]TXL08415.1 carbohydrate-binding protein [Methylococcaceae bacterium CS1]TXL09388.1 carbohydrate-binding protein [Methylococcaceae bacterium CS3]TXL11991.1 carbohydrate-binding protein [Methylococcaceae bacterium CS2]
MRKRIITPDNNATKSPEFDWLNLEEIAEVEISSEDVAYPIEFALLEDQTSGWRAAEPGTQIIRLLFARPQKLTRIWLSFLEASSERTQEYKVRCSSDNGQSFEEIVRQQWNFSPDGATSETEDFTVDLPAVTVLELIITPDINNDKAFASLAQLRLA